LPLGTASVCFYILNLTGDHPPERASAKYFDAFKKACLDLLKLKESQKPEGAPSKYLKILKKVCRVGLMITTLLFTVGIILPFEWSGLKALRGGTLKGVSALVTDNDVEYGAWFFGQDISVGSKDDQRYLYYFLGSEPIRIGHRYIFLMIPDYPIILQHTKIE
jgi:hypothetical protein